MISMIGDGELFMHAGYSLMRVLLGFVVAAVIAIPLGIAMGWVKRDFLHHGPDHGSAAPDTAHRLDRPGASSGSTSASPRPIFLVFIGAFFPILLNTVSGVRSVDRKLIEVASTFGARDLEVLRKVVVPAALPTIYTGMRVGMGIGWMCVVAAEMVAVKFGLGNLILEASNFLQTDRVFVGMISIGILGLVINLLFQIAGDRIFAWQQGIGKGGSE